MRNIRVQRQAYLAFAAALCLAAAVAIVVLLSKESGDFAGDVGTTAVALLVNGLAISAGIALRDRPGLGWLALVSVVVGIAGFATGAALGWSSSDQDPAEGLLKAAGVFTVFSLALGQTAILLARRSPGRFASSAVAVAATGALALAALLTVAILKEIGDEDFYRWLGVAAVIWVLGTGLVPLARKLQPSGANGS